MVLPGWIGNQGDVVEGRRSTEALVWEQWPLLGRCGFGHGSDVSIQRVFKRLDKMFLECPAEYFFTQI